MTLAEIHARLGNTAMLFALALGLWGLWLYLRKQPPSDSYFGGMVIGEILFVAQAVAGGALYLSRRTLGAAEPVHILYGALALITLPAAYAYLRTQNTRRESLMLGLAGLFLFGVALRAITTAR